MPILLVAVRADLLIGDGDGLTPVTANPLNLGTVCAGQPKSGTVLLAIRRVGQGNVFADSTNVTVTVVSVSSTELTVSMTDGSIALPSDWGSQPNNTMSSDTAASIVTLNTPTLGAFTGSVTYKASGPKAGGGTLELIETVTINGNVQLCDTTPPVIEHTISPFPNANGWNNSDVTVSWTVSDPESGIASSSGCDSITLTTETAGTTLTCSATNGAGLSKSVSVTIRIDKTKPNPPTATISPTPNASGWNNSTPVTVSFTPTGDAGPVQSGIASCTAPVSLTTETAGTPVSGTCTDNAGNTSDPTTVTVKIDTTPPVFGSCPTAGPFLLGSGLQTVGPIPASDALSGLNTGASTLTGTVDTSSVGTKTLTFTAVDNAGNSASTSCSYSVIYNFSGFFQPVDNPGPSNPPMFNRVKAGSAIPVKFSLHGYQGLNIFADGYPLSMRISCSNSAPTDDIEQTVTAGGSSLNYDPTSDQYIYVWKTDQSWGGTCRKLVVKLNDGTEHVAYFTFVR